MSDRAIKNCEEAAEQRDVWPGSADAKEPQPADYCCGVNAERNHGAELQAGAYQDLCGMALEVGCDYACRFPWSGKPRRLHAEWDSEAAYGAQPGNKQDGINNGQSTEVWTTMTDGLHRRPLSRSEFQFNYIK